MYLQAEQFYTKETKIFGSWFLVGAIVPWRKAERGGKVQFGKKKTSGRPYCDLPVSISGAYDKGIFYQGL